MNDEFLPPKDVSDNEELNIIRTQSNENDFNSLNDEPKRASKKQRQDILDVDQNEEEKFIPSLVDITQFLTCPLCRGYLKDAHTVSECVHTFCKSCLFIALNAMPSNRTCPMQSCNTHIVVKAPNGVITYQKVIADHSRQSMVNLLIPQAIAADKTREIEFNQKFNIQPKLEKSVVDESKYQIPSNSEHLHTNSDLRSKPQQIELIVTFYIVPVPDANVELALPDLAKPMLRTEGKMKISKVKSYLSKKISVDENCIDIFYKGSVMQNSTTLQMIFSSDPDEVMTDKQVLHYQKKSAD